MPGRTPRRAATDFYDAFKVALGCITPARLTFLDSPIHEGDIGTVVLNGNDPAPLNAPDPLWFYAAHRFVVRRPTDPAVGKFTVSTHAYSYRFLTGISDEDPAGEEVLAFHWTPFTDDPDQRSHPHCHIGPAVLARPTPVATGRFHKVHIPTDRLCVERVIQIAIDEFGVRPRHDDWRATLQRGIDGFNRLRSDRP